MPSILDLTFVARHASGRSAAYPVAVLLLSHTSLGIRSTAILSVEVKSMGLRAKSGNSQKHPRCILMAIAATSHVL